VSQDVAPRLAQYRSALKELLDAVDVAALESVVLRLRGMTDGAVYLAGNGGSAATASHWANDLATVAQRCGRGPTRVVCLSDNASAVTALGNDEGFKRIFAAQLERCANPGDVLVVLSASGNSPNLVEAVKVAGERGIHTIGLLGFDGGALRTFVDEAIWVHSEVGAYGLVESVHAVLCDMITSCLGEAADAR
jgi:D-sedoheptulose 7-phosphate isomerase